MMKKLLCIILIMITALGCLAGCNLTQKLTGAMADQAQATPKLEQMMAALAEERTDDAKALLHPDKADTSDAAIAQMSAFLAGRTVTSTQAGNVQFNASKGASGSSRTESIDYKLTLSDDTIIYISVVYLSDDNGAGFTSFQIVLGLVE